MTSTPSSTDVLTPSPVRAAVAAGLVTAREVTAGAVTLHGPALMLHDRVIAYASEPSAHQLSCLRLLAETGLVPEVLRTPQSHRAYGSVDHWIEAIRGTRLGDLTGTMAELADVCQAWGASLATLHQTRVAPGAQTPVAPRPWVLDPDRLPREMRQAPAGSARAHVLRTLCSDRGLLRTTTRVADRWSAEQWTHADLTAERVLVQQRPELRVRFVDLRAGGLGDPAWDLAGALETITELTGGPRPRWRSADAGCLADFLLRGYRRSGGTAVVDAGTRALRIVARAWVDAAALDARGSHPATMHPAAGQPVGATRLSQRLAVARELAARCSRPGLVAA